MDIRTILWLLCIGNLITIPLLFAYDIPEQRRAYRIFLISKMIQASAWLFLSLRSYIPDVISMFFGNALLFVGFSLESAALIGHAKASKHLEHFLVLIVCAGGILLYWFLDTTHVRVAISSLVPAILYGVASIVLLKNIKGSRLQKYLAMEYGLLAAVLIGRAAIGFFAIPYIHLLSGGITQNITFIVLFLYMLTGGLGFVLLLKERSDIDLQTTHRELKLQEHLLSNIFDTSSVSICMTDAEGNIVLANKKMAEMFGYPMAELMGRNYLALISPAQIAVATQHIHSLLRGEISFINTERQYQRRDASVFWGALAVTRVFDPKRNAYGFLGTITDISALKESEARILELARRDTLTGLPNRTVFGDLFNQALALAQRNHQSIAILFIDLDEFKPINDTYGHAVGDQVLQEVALRLRNAVRKSDTVARLGGDEFVVLLPAVTKGAAAQNVAIQIIAALSETIELDEGSVNIGSSIGVAVYPENGHTELELMQAADTAMYQAKRNGKNTAVCASDIQ